MYFCLLRLVNIRPARVIFYVVMFSFMLCFSNIYRGEISAMSVIE